jgi:hypothetical protein
MISCKRISNPIFRKYSIESTKKSIQNLNKNTKINTKPSPILFIILFSYFISFFTENFIKKIKI